MIQPSINLFALCKDSSDSFMILLNASSFDSCRLTGGSGVVTGVAAVVICESAIVITDLLYWMASAFVRVVMLPCPSK
jgi:hypothetical protein